jgi:hypothetical protein
MWYCSASGAERQRENIGEVERGARGVHGREIPVQHVQRDRRMP